MKPAASRLGAVVALVVLEAERLSGELGDAIRKARAQGN
jgi:hypothetical protein